MLCTPIYFQEKEHVQVNYRKELRDKMYMLQNAPNKNKKMKNRCNRNFITALRVNRNKLWSHWYFKLQPCLSLAAAA